MKVLVTGASGYIGQRLSIKLADMGYEVHAFIRDEKAEAHLQHKNIFLFYGDLLDADKLNNAMNDCEQVYHVAALARMWVKDRSAFYKVNVAGTNAVINAARRNGVKKLVFTSSTGVIGPSISRPMTESDPRITSFNNDYELSKHLAEKAVIEAGRNGLQCVIVSPSRVYGPGISSPSSGVNNFIRSYLKRGFAFIPSVKETLGNYCFIDDVVDGHILAMQSGRNGEKYILGGDNISFYDFFEAIRTESDKGQMIRVSPFLIMVSSWIELLKSKIFRTVPSVTPELVRRLFQNQSFDCLKAKTELGYTITPFHMGISKTIQFILNNSK